MPCPSCNVPDAGRDPLPKGFRRDTDKKGWRH
jgi:hypothetical protein